MDKIDWLYQNITWTPYKLLFKFSSKKRNSLILNLRKIGINKSLKFNVSENDEGLSRDLEIFGFREPLNLNYFYKFVTKEDKVLDVGANIGLFSLLSHNAKKIVSIEPIEECIPLLKKNLKENELLKKSEVIRMAVGKKGKLRLKKEGKINLSRIVSNKGKNTIEVKSMPLNYFVKKFKTNFLRMDVEGYEYEILMNKIPKKINKIAIEFHMNFLGKKKSFELLNYFEKEGFKVKYFIEDLPIRLYPFYSILKNLKLLGFFTYVLKDQKPVRLFPLLVKGRCVKYFFLERRDYKEK